MPHPFVTDDAADGTLDPYGKTQLSELTDKQLLDLRETLAGLVAARKEQAAAFIQAAENKKKRAPRTNKKKTADATDEVKASAHK